MRLHFICFVFLLSAHTVFATPMARVVAVVDPQTISIERDGVVSNVHLAGIEVNDPHNALQLLSWTLSGAWVLVEDGFVYRSPDGLLVNRELVAKGFARSTAPETSCATIARGVYLGEASPGPAVRTPSRGAAQPAARVEMKTVRRPPRSVRSAPRVAPKATKRK